MGKLAAEELPRGKRLRTSDSTRLRGLEVLLPSSDEQSRLEICNAGATVCHLDTTAPAFRRQRRRCGSCGGPLAQRQSGHRDVEYSCDVGGQKGRAGETFWCCDKCSWDVCSRCEDVDEWHPVTLPLLLTQTRSGLLSGTGTVRCSRRAEWRGMPAFSAECTEAPLPGGRILKWGTGLRLAAQASSLVRDLFPGCNPNTACASALTHRRVMLHGIVADVPRAEGAARAVAGWAEGRMYDAAGLEEEDMPRGALSHRVRVTTFGAGLARLDDESNPRSGSWALHAGCLLCILGPSNPRKPHGMQRCLVHLPAPPCSAVAAEADRPVTRAQEKDSSVVGAVRFYVDSAELVLEYLTVRADARSSGLGAGLANTLAGLAASAGLPPPLVVSFRGSVSWWQRLGCVKLEDADMRRRYNPWSDAVLMRLPSKQTPRNISPVPAP